MKIRNLEFLKGLTTNDLPGFGQRLYEALLDVQKGVTAIAQQTNSNPDGQPASPPQINSIQVKARNGMAHVSITDNNQIYRGIRYYVEHADNPHFKNAMVQAIYDARNVTIPIGNQTRYFRAYSSYATSAPSAPVYHGGSQPIGVQGGGSDSGPEFGLSQGSGTGPQGATLQGPGLAPFRGTAPPIRAANELVNNLVVNKLLPKK